MKPRRGGLLRTTLQDVADGAQTPTVGVYLLAELGQVVYVGKADDGVDHRLRQHMHRGSDIGKWLYSRMESWRSVRLDVLIPPGTCADVPAWVRNVELACIRRFHPLLNTAALGRR